MQEKIKRSFILGDEWLYYKIYTGVKTADLILIHYLNILIRKNIEEKNIDKWFFIRYTDPEFHLRLRIHISDNEKLLLIINQFNLILKGLLNKDLIWKVQLDTYNRELERYGFNTIDQSESLFHHDSELIINGLVIIEESENDNLIWLFGLLIIDSLMNDFNLSIYDKKSLMESLKTTFGVEMGLDKNLKKQLSVKYQKHKIEIFNIFNPIKEEDNEIKFIKKLIENKSLSNLEHTKLINEKETNLNNIIASHIHMAMNRLFRNKNRETEFVTYQMLFYYYESILARTKYDKINIQ